MRDSRVYLRLSAGTFSLKSSLNLCAAREGSIRFVIPRVVWQDGLRTLPAMLPEQTVQLLLKAFGVAAPKAF
jgi:hypothetical protein